MRGTLSIGLAATLLAAATCNAQSSRGFEVDWPDSVSPGSLVVVPLQGVTDGTVISIKVRTPDDMRIVTDATIGGDRSIVFAAPCAATQIELIVAMVDFDERKFSFDEVTIAVTGARPPPDTNPPTDPPPTDDDPPPALPRETYDAALSAARSIEYSGVAADRSRIATVFDTAANEAAQNKWDDLRAMSIEISRRNYQALDQDATRFRAWSDAMGPVLQDVFIPAGIATVADAAPHLRAVAQAIRDAGTPGQSNGGGQ